MTVLTDVFSPDKGVRRSLLVPAAREHEDRLALSRPVLLKVIRFLQTLFLALEFMFQSRKKISGAAQQMRCRPDVLKREAASNEMRSLHQHQYR